MYLLVYGQKRKVLLFGCLIELNMVNFDFNL